MHSQMNEDRTKSGSETSPTQSEQVGVPSTPGSASPSQEDNYQRPQQVNESLTFTTVPDSNNGKTKQVDWTDERGMKHRVTLPSRANNDSAPRGILVGPPDLSTLRLPEDIEVKLSNELASRGLFQYSDISRHRDQAQAAILASIRLDVDLLMAAYFNQNSKQ